MLTSSVKKYEWEKGEEWPEKWYHTQLCFQTFAKNNNPLAKFFAPNGLSVIALNTSWFYEEKSSNDWDIGKAKAASDPEILGKLISESENLLAEVKIILKNLERSKNIDDKSLGRFKVGFLLLWSVFLADLGRPLGGILEQRLRNKDLNSEQKGKVKDYCFRFKHQLGFQQEEKNLNKINSAYQKKYKGRKIKFNALSNNIKNMIIDHWKKFQYLTGGELDTQSHSPEDFFGKLSSPTSNRDTYSQALPREIKSRLGSTDLRLLRLISRHVYLDNYAADLDSKLDFILNQLISRSFKISARQLSWYSFQEIEQLIKRNIFFLDGDQLRERKQHRIMWQIDGKLGTYYGKQNYSKIAILVNSKQPKIKVREFRGMVACQGRVKGEVKIVKQIKDMNKVQTGNILVAINTHPDLMMAIKRCSGIITDYGGITSHAAIVSREFNIPCVVGTTIATQVLKDGDLVDLDAYSGLIKILERG